MSRAQASLNRDQQCTAERTNSILVGATIVRLLRAFPPRFRAPASPALRAALNPRLFELMRALARLARSGSRPTLYPLLAFLPVDLPLPDALRPLIDQHEAHLVEAQCARTELAEVEWDQVVEAGHGRLDGDP